MFVYGNTVTSKDAKPGGIFARHANQHSVNIPLMEIEKKIYVDELRVLIYKHGFFDEFFYI